MVTTSNGNELAEIIGAYHAVTERLKQSHEILMREVCRLRDELHEKNRELARRERLAALGEMAAGVAHEIRNPLGGIGLYASLLEKDLQDRCEQADLVQKIRVGVRSLESIVGDILAFAGGQEPHKQSSDLQAIIDDVMTHVRPQAGAQEVRVECGDFSGVIVLVDARQVERALVNLVRNAVEATGSGGSVRVFPGEIAERDRLAGVVIEDDGPGIPAELLHRVFNPFFTTKDTGTGLGLAIVHRIAEAHGGYVTAGNRAQGGARFQLALPIADTASVMVGGPL